MRGLYGGNAQARSELTALLGAAVRSGRAFAQIAAADSGFRRHTNNAASAGPFLAVATALLACFAAVYFSGRENEISPRRRPLCATSFARQTIELTRLNEAFAILNGPDTTVTTFGAGPAAPPKGKVFVNPRQGVLLIASNLPPAPAGKAYEMWVIPKARQTGAAPACSNPKRWHGDAHPARPVGRPRHRRGGGHAGRRGRRAAAHLHAADCRRRSNGEPGYNNES